MKHQMQDAKVRVQEREDHRNMRRKMDWDWQGKDLRAKVLYSQKGIATQIWVATSTGYFLMDCGDGILRDLFPYSSAWIHHLSAILLSHSHFDHVAGLFALLSFLRLRNRRAPLVIASPDRSFLQEIRRFRDRVFAGFPYELDLQSIAESNPYQCAGIEIRSFAVPHSEHATPFGQAMPVQAAGYRLESAQGEIVLYSGDSGWFAGLSHYVRGVDLAILEATFDLPKGEGRHLTLEQAQQLGCLAKATIFVHR
jgi:ribonuclease BN (tRNA processing enzyme)